MEFRFWSGLNSRIEVEAGASTNPPNTDTRHHNTGLGDIYRSIVSISRAHYTLIHSTESNPTQLQGCPRVRLLVFRLMLTQSVVAK